METEHRDQGKPESGRVQNAQGDRRGTHRDHAIEEDLAPTPMPIPSLLRHHGHGGHHQGDPASHHMEPEESLYDGGFKGHGRAGSN